MGKKDLKGFDFFSFQPLMLLIHEMQHLVNNEQSRAVSFFRFLAEAGARIFLNNPTFINSVFKNLVHLEKMGLDCGSGSF